MADERRVVEGIQNPSPRRDLLKKKTSSRGEWSSRSSRIFKERKRLKWEQGPWLCSKKGEN